MENQSAAITDPAREVADLLSELVTDNPNLRGGDYLAQIFDVEPWGQDFYRIISTIIDRLEFLKEIIRKLDLDEDYRDEMIGHLNEINKAFSLNAFQNTCNVAGRKNLSPQNIQPLKGLSPSVRQRISYRKLSTEELIEIADEVAKLLEWLKEHQLAENDFIRQALMEGLEAFLFRVEHFRWLGMGYALDSLREVITAYMALERQDIDKNINPDAAAVLVKVGEVIRFVYSKIDKTKGVYEAGDWLLRVYGAISVAQVAAPSISGILPSS